ncbi:hypothetical protein TOT_040000641 [Theileria orientalis strain Shintoku]|uniref:Uncharacterized protein n=1 Tax=Theileria orientalis strain Shintoku TaxID=869250 RepID=J4CE49_THEOR|nr:hypothetical protein TOT_040000641 [Theileria orientalis strain Shintoku]BAM42272.1 hypothetical protein TOT_040000641 [Theileria orientalis strain Shintoku]|eukprot:XP_009692573.1 hypothetical protein TOT_040000641 [Theileria orientalis strain Shintoku]
MLLEVVYRLIYRVMDVIAVDKFVYVVPSIPKVSSYSLPHLLSSLKSSSSSALRSSVLARIPSSAENTYAFCYLFRVTIAVMNASNPAS